MRSSYCAVLLLWACVVSCLAAPALRSEVPLAVVVAGGRPQADVSQPATNTDAVASYELDDLGMDMDNMSMGGMQMTFFGSNTFDLWFEGFHVHDAGTLTAACLGIGIAAILYEGLKVARIILVDKMDCSGYQSSGHWVQVFLHVVQVTVGYFLMLATMTYSSWLMISLCAGAGIGYAIFGLMVPTKALLGGAGDHCH